MLALLKRCVSVFFIFSAAASSAQALPEWPNPPRTDYPEWLYPLRTYYFVETTRPASHHFEVWVRNEKLIWTPFDLSVETLDGLQQMKVSDLKPSSRVFAGFPKPKDDMASKDISPRRVNTLKRRISQLFPKAKDYRVFYQGQFGELKVTEIVPVSPEAKPTRVGYFGSALFRFNKAGKMESQPESISRGGYGDLASERIGPHAEMLGFVLPIEIDGSTLLYDVARLDRPITGQPTVHQVAATNLVQALQSWLRQKPRPRPGTVQNQVRRHQEQTEADRDLRQRFDIEIDVYIDAADGNRELEKTLVLPIPVDRAIAGTVYFSKTDLRLGINYELTGGFGPEHTMTLTIKDGASTLTRQILAEPSLLAPLIDGGSSALLGPVSLKLMNPPNNNQGDFLGTLRGANWISPLDFTLSSVALPSREVGVARGSRSVQQTRTGQSRSSGCSSVFRR